MHETPSKVVVIVSLQSLDVEESVFVGVVVIFVVWPGSVIVEYGIVLQPEAVAV